MRAPSPRSRSRRREGGARPTTPRLRARSQHRLHTQQSPRLRAADCRDAVAPTMFVVKASWMPRSRRARSRRRDGGARATSLRVYLIEFTTRLTKICLSTNRFVPSSTVIRRTTSTAMPPSACRWSGRRSREWAPSPLACSRGRPPPTASALSAYAAASALPPPSSASSHMTSAALRLALRPSPPPLRHGVRGAGALRRGGEAELVRRGAAPLTRYPGPGPVAGAHGLCRDADYPGSRPRLGGPRAGGRT